MTAENTLPRLVFRNAQSLPDRPAWRHKRLGIWQTLSWSAFAARVRDIAAGLAAHGFAHGDRLAVLGDNRPDLYAAMLAAQTLGGAGVPLDPYAEPDRLSAILAEARIAVAIADNVDRANWMQALAAVAAPTVNVFCADPGGLHRDDTWDRRSLDELIKSGRGRADAAADTAPQDVALVLYPLDVGHPLVLSHAQLVAAAEAIEAADPVKPVDEMLCYLPMSSYEDAVYSLALGVLGGCVGNCPEAPDSTPRDLREIGPTIMFASTAACVALTDTIAAKADAVSGMKRRSFAFFRRQALRAEALREQGQAVPAGVALACRLGEALAYAPVRDQLGLSRARWVHTGASLPLDTARLLRAFGVALRSDTGIAATPARSPETQHA